MFKLDLGLLTAMVIPWVLLVALCSANVAYIACRCYNLKLKRGSAIPNGHDHRLVFFFYIQLIMNAREWFQLKNVYQRRKERYME